MTSSWWRNAVMYQVYVRSFADSNADGTGDINGITSKLSHLAELGVSGLWINPWYASPLLDGGYDVADYRAIEPSYGDLDDAKNMIARAHELDLKVLVDLVPNHTSFEHVWFKEAAAAPIGDPSRERYLIRDGRGSDGSEPPTNWKSVFGGPAWTRLDDGQWYLHLFDSSQPDLNWTNTEVQEEFKDILRFWLDIGADGFRVDVAHGLAKDMAFPDDEASVHLLQTSRADDHPFWDRDEVHGYIRQWREVLDSYDDRMMVAEAWVRPDRIQNYVRPDEYHQSFAFDFLESNWDADELRANVIQALEATAAVASVPTWVLSNHDVVRHPTRYGLPSEINNRRWLLEGPHDVLDGALGQRRARAAIMFMLSLPGGVYLYQGEELGLPEVWDLPVDVLDDPVWTKSSNKIKGRDGCRVPIPWTTGGPSFGFSDIAGWLPQPETFGAFSVESQTGDAGSMLEHYRQALALRTTEIPESGDIDWIDGPSASLLGFERPGGLVCWINFGADSVSVPDGAEVLLASDPSFSGEVATDTAVWFRRAG